MGLFGGKSLCNQCAEPTPVQHGTRRLYADCELVFKIADPEGSAISHIPLAPNWLVERVALGIGLVYGNLKRKYHSTWRATAPGVYRQPLQVVLTYSSASSQTDWSLANGPPAATKASNVPSSTTAPSATTRIRSARLAVWRR